MDQTPRCACGIPKKAKAEYQGSGLLEILLWCIAVVGFVLFFIHPDKIYYYWMAFVLPALGYTIWRNKSGYYICRQCGLPINSRRK